jgi:putative endonuclease
MKDPKTLGKKGEELALMHLLQNGYEILEVNWSRQHLEIDLIAKKEDRLVFVEVKTRSTSQFGEPFEFVKPVKQNRLFRAANLYYREKELLLEARFDIISVLITEHETEIRHLEDAFYPIA